MNHIYEYKDYIDPFEEEDWEEQDSKIFHDEETDLELEWNPSKATMDGWSVRSIYNNKKLVDFIKKYFNKRDPNEKQLLLMIGYIVRLKVEEYSKFIR